MAISVVTYNLLSPRLCDRKTFVRCHPHACDSKKRFKVIKDKLTSICSERSILCLQELTRDWQAKLLPTFVELGYVLVCGHYGNFRNGYMGVAIAYPNDLYELKESKISRVFDTKFWPTPTPTPPTLLQKIFYFFTTIILFLYSFFSCFFQTNKDDQPTENLFESATRRQNVQVMLRLLHRQTKLQFVVGPLITIILSYSHPTLFSYPLVLVHIFLTSSSFSDLSHAMRLSKSECNAPSSCNII
jgi:hypothetical protein